MPRTTEAKTVPTGGPPARDDPQLAELVRHYVRAERDAAQAATSLERLLAACRPLAEGLARTYAGDEADVADMVQEALLALARDLPQLRNPAAFPAWFATLVHHRCRDWLRRERTRRAESLDRPPRPGWLGPGEGPRPVDVPDPGAARLLLSVETGDALRRLARTLPEQQWAAVSLAYLEGRSHEGIGRALGVSPRAAEGLVYRGLRRLKAVAAQCTDEPQALAVWCPRCGQHRLEAQLLPGVAPRGPLWRRWRCPACGLASHWTEQNLVPLAPYPSLDAAWWDERRQWAPAARHHAGATGLRCWKCGAPALRRDRPGETAAGTWTPYVLRWPCFRCDVGTFYAPLFAAVAGLAPEWLAFWRAAPRLLIESERVVRRGGETQVVLAACDRESGRRATLAVDRDTLQVRQLHFT